MGKDGQQVPRAINGAIGSSQHSFLGSGSNERRFESVNEFRSQQRDIIAGFLTRAEYQAAHQSLVEKIDDLSARMDRQTGGNSATYRFIGWGFAAFGVFCFVWARNAKS